MPGVSAAADTAESGPDAADFENREILVSRVDGSTEVMACKDAAALATTLKVPAQDATVAAVQCLSGGQFCSGRRTVRTAVGALQQRSFQMTEQGNTLPVHDGPFGTPSQPGQWTMPDEVRGRAWTGLTAAGQTVTAMAGVDINAREAWSVHDGGSREVVIA